MTIVSDTIESPRPSLRPAERKWRRERLFFGGMALAMVATVFAGFAPSYYLHRVLASPNVLTPSLIAHGMAFTGWMMLLVAQTSLIAARRTDLHRKLGMAGAGLAVVMMGLAGYVAITRYRAGVMAPPPGLTPETLLAVAFGTLLVFPVLVGTGLLLRRDAAAHKRLMLIATIELVTAAVGRIPGGFAFGLIGLYAFSDVFVAALAVHDLGTRRRIHPATLWGGLFLVASQPLRTFIGGTAPWIAFAGWMAS